MFKNITFIFFLLLTFHSLSSAEEKLVLELDLESDLLSLSHNIDNFLFLPTRNYQVDKDNNINSMDYRSLKNYLAATGLVRLNNEVIGFATEQEIVYKDSETQRPMAHSMWMLTLNHPGLTGFLAVEQVENASSVYSMVQKVMADKDKDWSDEWQMYLSTSGETKVHYASGDLSKYQGGIFEEYNGINPADLRNYGKFRGRISFVIYPAP